MTSKQLTQNHEISRAIHFYQTECVAISNDSIKLEQGKQSYRWKMVDCGQRNETITGK